MREHIRTCGRTRYARPRCEETQLLPESVTCQSPNATLGSYNTEVDLLFDGEDD